MKKIQRILDEKSFAKAIGVDRVTLNAWRGKGLPHREESRNIYYNKQSVDWIIDHAQPRFTIRTPLNLKRIEKIFKKGGERYDER